MSSVKITGNASGTGVFTVESPNSNTDRTLTLPDGAGTVLISPLTASLDLNGNELILDVDGDTSITSDTDDQIDFRCAGVDRLIIGADGSLTSQPAASGTIVFNEASNDVDFRIESDANTHAFFLEGSTGNVGIGASSVDRQVHIEGSRSNAYSSSDFDNTYNLVKIENPNTANNMATGIQFLVGSNGSASITTTRTADGEAALCFGTRGGGSRAERFRVDASGNILHGTTTHLNAAKYLMEFDRVPNTGFTIENTNGTSATQHIIFRNSNGNVGSVTVDGSSTSFNTSSDHRLKQGVEDMTGAIDRVKALAPKRFQFIADADTTVDGFLAHEAQAVVPEAVTGTHNEVETWTQQQIDDDDAPDGTSAGDNKLNGGGNTIPVMQGIDQSKLVPLLCAALKESIAKIETLETKVAALEAK